MLSDLDLQMAADVNARRKQTCAKAREMQHGVNITFPFADFELAAETIGALLEEIRELRRPKTTSPPHWQPIPGSGGQAFGPYSNLNIPPEQTGWWPHDFESRGYCRRCDVPFENSRRSCIAPRESWNWSCGWGGARAFLSRDEAAADHERKHGARPLCHLTIKRIR